MSQAGRSREIDCEGRFFELREHIVSALDLVLESSGSTTVSRDDLESVLELIQNDVPFSDPKDPYFKNPDGLRHSHTFENAKYADLVPFIPREYGIEDKCVADYVDSQNVTGSVGDALSQWHKGLNLDINYGLQNRKISFTTSDKKNKDGSPQLNQNRAELKGYTLVSKFGIGRNEGDKVVSDTPYGIELIDSNGNLALYVGFWAKQEENQNTMVVAQIQNPTRAQLPGGEEAKMGIVGLEIARLVGEAIGFDKIETYTAKTHPMFRQYPDRCAQMKGDFSCLYNKSAKVLGWTGTNTTFYSVQLKQT